VIIIKSDDELRKMAHASKIVAEVLELLKEFIAPGVTTKDIESFAEEIIRRRGGTATFKGYRGYPASLCASVNEEVVHGIPSKKKILKEGDVVKIDVGVTKNGFIGDAARSYPVGKISESAAKLLRVTEESLSLGIEKACRDNRVFDISHSIQRHVEEHGYSVVRAFVGHGVGRDLHEEPPIPNYGPPGKGPRLKCGMVLAIEPMINSGGHEVRILDDGWTAVTKDGNLSAHFEHTVAVTDKGPQILTIL